MKNLKVTIDQETLRKIKRGQVREMRMEQGASDGRFNTKVVKSKKKYSKSDRRKNKRVEY